MPLARMFAVVAFYVLTFLPQARAAEAQWTNISDPLIAQIAPDPKKIPWPGQTAGIVVDRTTGNVFMAVSGMGLFKSTDRGATFVKCDDGKVGGRCETASALCIDPATGRLACFMLDGKCGMTLDGAKTWQAFKDVGRNWDFAAVDWTSEKPQVIYAARHETGGEMYLSTDAGGSWTKLDKDNAYCSLGVVDANIFLTSKGQGLLRSTDQGKEWKKVSNFTPISRVMQTMNGAQYFFATNSDDDKKKAATYQSFLIVSRDKGATWSKQGTETDAAWGPYFGKDEKHLITVGRKGMILESTDAGETWKDVIALPAKGFDTSKPGWFTNVAYDPKSDTFYISKMGLSAFKYERK